jgi:hypothetical protein
MAGARTMARACMLSCAGLPSRCAQRDLGKHGGSTRSVSRTWTVQPFDPFVVVLAELPCKGQRKVATERSAAALG